MSIADPEMLARQLTRSAGLAVPLSLAALAGGKNNRVFRVMLDDGVAVVLKCYHHDPRDQRDRLAAEWRFLSHVWELGVRNVPQPLAALSEHHAGLYGFVAGRRPEMVDDNLMLQAADFVTAINSPAGEPQRLAPGSEACFSLADHLEIVARRIARLADLDPAAPHVDDARILVARRLDPAWLKVRAHIERQATARSIAFGKPIAREAVSPSDFGFHNALVDESGRVSFIDFEYAGRDDIAKLVCDFFCQPEVTAPIASYPAFTTRLERTLKLDEEELWRCRILLNAYRIKWACIILNEFTALGGARRAFADTGDRGTRSAGQLERAEQQISLVTL